MRSGWAGMVIWFGWRFGFVGELAVLDTWLDWVGLVICLYRVGLEIWLGLDTRMGWRFDWIVDCLSWFVLGWRIG